jgi:hypothetical protein
LGQPSRDGACTEMNINLLVANIQREGATYREVLTYPRHAYLPVCLTCLPRYLQICVLTYQPASIPAYLHTYRPTCLPTYLPTGLLTYLPTYLRFEVFTAVTMKNAIFLDATPCGSCKNRRSGGTCRLHHQGEKNRRTRNNVCSN